MWAFPGGQLNRDDSCLEAATQREVREETGLDIPLYLFQQVQPYAHIPQFDARLLGIFCTGHQVVVLCGRNMSCPAFLVSIVQLCSLFRAPHAFYRAAYCGMWDIK